MAVAGTRAGSLRSGFVGLVVHAGRGEFKREPLDGLDGVVIVIRRDSDFRDDAVLQQLEQALAGRPVDVVVSDMAPNLSGIASADAARMADLVELAVDFAERHLQPDGALVAKVFHGSGYSQLVERFKRAFRVVKPHKPKASRDRSSETFLVGIGPKPDTAMPKALGSRGNTRDSGASKT